jgi:hypothetical protein
MEQAAEPPKAAEPTAADKAEKPQSKGKRGKKK